MNIIYVINYNYLHTLQGDINYIQSEVQLIFKQIIILSIRSNNNRFVLLLIKIKKEDIYSSLSLNEYQI